VCRGAQRRLQGYGDLSAGTRVGDGDTASELVADVDEAWGVGAEAPGCSMRQQATSRRLRSQGKAIANRRRRTSADEPIGNWQAMAFMMRPVVRESSVQARRFRR
jgi:hypothetical protein